MDQDENTPWQYKPDDSGNQANPVPSDGSPDVSRRSRAAKSVSWEAAEFIEHPHPATWYLSLIAIIAVLAALVYLAFKDYIATVIILIVGVIVGVFAHQKPGRAMYEITDSGLSINGKTYNFSDYKSFAVIDEGTMSSLNLFPLKRLMPPLSAYFDSKDEDKITNVLGNYLPYEERKLDNIERLSRRLRL
jgi:hypothetical protein